jgi:RNA polymerase sigma-70 factor (ECF subfamily)
LVFRLREFITLVYYRALTYPQVTACLGVGLLAVKSRIRAGPEHLETDLSDR